MSDEIRYLADSAAEGFVLFPIVVLIFVVDFLITPAAAPPSRSTCGFCQKRRKEDQVDRLSTMVEALQKATQYTATSRTPTKQIHKIDGEKNRRGHVAKLGPKNYKKCQKKIGPTVNRTRVGRESLRVFLTESQMRSHKRQ
jgi:hypothetical protein